MVMTVGCIPRFFHNLNLASLGNKEQNSNREQNLNSDEFENATLFIFQFVKGQNYQERINNLRKGKKISKGSPLFKLSPVLDVNGVLRATGRLQMSKDLTFGEKHPIILPKCHLVLLLVRFHHLLLKHTGVPLLLTSLRNDYWIFGLRVLSKKVCRECIAGQRQDSRECKQIPAPLPLDRISRSFPFAVVEVGLLVHLSVMTQKERSICLFVAL